MRGITTICSETTTGRADKLIMGHASGMEYIVWSELELAPRLLAVREELGAPMLRMVRDIDED